MGYDLTQGIPNIFRQLGTLTSVMRRDDATNSQRLEISTFISGVDSQLHKSTRTPDREGPTSRRFNIIQVFDILVLIYATLISSYEGASTEIFLYRYEKLLKVELTVWGRIIADIFRLLLIEVEFQSDQFTTEMTLLIDACIGLGWESWREAKLLLLGFFVNDPACHGSLQELWKSRIG